MPVNGCPALNLILVLPNYFADKSTVQAIHRSTCHKNSNSLIYDTKAEVKIQV